MAALLLLLFPACDQQTGHNPDNPDRVAERGGSELRNTRQNAITTAIHEVRETVVGIRTTQIAEHGGSLEFDWYQGFQLEQRQQQEHHTIGSGFIISDDGYVLTNEHISSFGAEEIIISMHDGTLYPAELVDADMQTDIALLKIEADTTFQYVTFADSDAVQPGEWAIAIGNPTDMYEDGKPTVTVGVISASNRSLRSDPRSNRYYLDMIQTDATINPANAGGPLVDADGKVIGINTMIQTGQRSQMQPGMGFAIPSNRLKPLIEAFKKGGSLAHDFDPGIETVPVTHEISNRYGLSVDHGLFVLSVNKDGPAYECGILPGDVLLKVDNQRLLGEAHTMALFNQYSHGDSIDLEVMREGDSFDTSMLLRKRAEAAKD